MFPVQGNPLGLLPMFFKKYKTETQSLFVKSAPNPSQVWLTAQIKKNRLTEADVEMIFIVIGDASAYT